MESTNLDKAILVGICTAEENPEDVEKSLAELERLLDTAGGVCYAKLIQSKEHPDPRTCIGSGKVAEIAGLCHLAEVSLVVFDTDLSPVQIRNVEDAIGKGVKVIDRSMLILDIFALHATTGEGKLQVELAQLKYTAPRLTGNGVDLSRQGGGIGSRGPGESKLESDRRHMKRRIDALEAELRILDKNRQTMRAARDRSGIKKVAIVGYTNAGKSTLLNYLTNAGVLAQDQLFATLDPTTRKLELPDGTTVLLTDTVGLIRKLPHHLIHAFKSTLDEAVYADVLMIVTDASDPEYKAQLDTTEQLLADLGANEKPTLYVYNKCDRGLDESFRNIGNPLKDRPTVAVSAKTGQGVALLLEKLTELVQEGTRTVTFHIPNAEAGVLNQLYRLATVGEVEYTATEIVVSATVDQKVYGMLHRYDPNWEAPDED